MRESPPPRAGKGKADRAMTEPTSYLKATKIEHFEWLLNEVKGYLDIDPTEAVRTVKDQIQIASHGGDPQPWNKVAELEARWYASLVAGQPDYSVYSDSYYVCDIWACWSLYSCSSVKAIGKPATIGLDSVMDRLGTANTILDLGCGFGFTTAALLELFPKARVIGTNLEESFQYDFCADLAEAKGFEIRPEAPDLKNVDLIFASEYFEHFQNSLEHVFEVITCCRPRMLVVANGYNGHAIGHFHHYLYRGAAFPAKQTSLNFGTMMRHLGYEKQKTTIWNNRPAVWIRK